MKNLIYLILFFVLIVFVIFLYKSKFVEVTAEFKKLRPVQKKINVYYNGFKMGKVTSVLPCKHSQGVCVKVVLDKSKMFIPSNITFKMKQKDTDKHKYEDYLEIIYPEKPSYTELQNNSILKGELAAGFRNYMNEEVDYNEVEQLKLSLLNTADNLQKSSFILIEILDNINSITETSKNDVIRAAKNFNRTSNNLTQITSNFDSFATAERLNSIAEDINVAASGIGNVGSGVLGIAGTIEGYSVKNPSNPINNILEDSSEIIRGINCTLRKPLGGLRLIFGKTIR